MKSLSNKTFPFPVLRTNSQDYVGEENDRVFQVTVVEEQVKGRATPEFLLQFELTQPDLLELIENGRAVYGILVKCRATMHHHLHKTSEDSLSLNCGPGVLGGPVVFHPYVIAADDFSQFKSDSFNGRWEGLTVFPRKGDVLAIGVRKQTHVGQEKFAPFGSCWSVVGDENKEPGHMDYNLETDEIQIVVSESEANWIKSQTKRKSSRQMIYQGIILNILQPVLRTMATDEDEHQGKKWFQVINRRLTDLGHRTLNEDMDFFQIAQELVEHPLKHLAKGER